MIIETISLIISYLGIFVGKLLSKIAKEEIIPGKKNLELFQTILFTLILVLFFNLVKMNMTAKIIIAAVLVAIELLFRNENALVGLMLGLEPTFLMCAAAFLYGFPTGSLMHRDNYVRIFRKTVIYLIFGLIGLLTRFLLTKTI